MKVIKFVAKISYNNISKLFCVGVDATCQNLYNAVIKEFKIPSNEAPEIKLWDGEGTLCTKDSLEQIIHRSISEGKIPHIIATRGDALSDSFMNLSANQLEAEDEQKKTQVKDFRSKVSKLFVSLNKIENKLHEAEMKLKQYETEIDSGIETEPTHDLNEPEPDANDMQGALKNQEKQLEESELREFESKLKKKEDELNQREIDLNKLRKRLNKRDNKLKNREVEVTTRETDVNMHHYTLNKLEDILNRLSEELKMKKEQLNEHEALLNQKEALLEEERSKIKCFGRIVRSKDRKCKAELDGIEEDTKVTSTSNYRTRVLTKSFLTELETKLSKQKSKGASSSGILNEEQVKLNESISDDQTQSDHFTEGSPNPDLQAK